MTDIAKEIRPPNFQETSWSPWREIAAIGLLFMDVSWLIAWHNSVFLPAGSLSKGSLYLIYGLIVFTAYVFTTVMQWLQLRANIRRAALLMILLGSYIFMLNRLLYPDQGLSVLLIMSNVQASFSNYATFLPPELFILALCIYLVFRSAMLVSSWIGQAVVRKRFRVGIMLLLLLGAISGFVLEINLTSEILVFLTSSFIALGAARTSNLSVLRGGVRQKISVVSVLSVSLSAILIAGLGFVLGDFASINLSDLTAMIFFFSMRLLLALTILVLSPVILLFVLFLAWLDANLGELAILQALELEIMKILEFIALLIESIRTFVERIGLRLLDLSWLRPYLLWAAVAMALFFLLREFGKRDLSLTKLRDVLIEERSLLSEASLRSWLIKFLEGRVSQISGRLSSLYRGNFLGALRIRRIYAKLMRLCERLDVGRPTTATPLEFLDELELIFPQERAQVRTITHAYNRVRYGERPETPEEVQAVEKAWRIVRERAKDVEAVRKQLVGGNHPE